MGLSKQALSLNAVDIIKEEILNANQSWFVMRKPQQNLNIYELGIVIYLEQGEISLYNKKSNSLIINLQAPVVIGLLPLTFNDEIYCVYTKTDCSLYSIKVEDLKNIINEKRLWKHVFDLLSVYIYQYARIELIFSNKTAKEVVLGSIKYIQTLPSEVQEKTSIYDFILSRCALSRSAVYNELKRLKDSGAISVRNGVVHTIAI